MRERVGVCALGKLHDANLEVFPLQRRDIGPLR